MCNSPMQGRVDGNTPTSKGADGDGGEQRVGDCSKSARMPHAGSLGSLQLTAVHDRDRIDREQEAARQLHERGRSDGRRNREELGEQRVEHGKGVGVRHKAGDLDDALEATAGVFEHCLEIREGLARLRFEGFSGYLSGRGIDSGLARGVDEVTDANGLRVGADSGTRGLSTTSDGNAMLWSR